MEVQFMEEIGPNCSGVFNQSHLTGRGSRKTTPLDKENWEGSKPF